MYRAGSSRRIASQTALGVIVVRPRHPIACPARPAVLVHPIRFNDWTIPGTNWREEFTKNLSKTAVVDLALECQDAQQQGLFRGRFRIPGQGLSQLDRLLESPEQRVGAMRRLACQDLRGRLAGVFKPEKFAGRHNSPSRLQRGPPRA